MDLKKIFIKDACPTKVGGQAVLEGIMMKGADRTAIVVRKSSGDMHIKIEPLAAPKKWTKIPLLRGVLAFVDSLITGTKTLLYSADVLEAEISGDENHKPEDDDAVTRFLTKHFGEKKAWNIMLYTSVVFALVLGVALFIVGPTLVTSLLGKVIENVVLLNLCEGLLRLLIFIVYVVLVARMEDIQRVFQYHGAEHKTIHAFENGLELTPANCQQFETLHPRCGTSFLMFVILISLVVNSLLGWPNLWLRVASRLLLLPVIAGLSYELLRWAGRSTSPIVKALSIPGLLTQKLTTRTPDDSQLEVAIAALRAVTRADGPKSFVGGIDTEGNLFEEAAPAVPAAATVAEDAAAAETPAEEA
ncbi:MAG: DUF1385 domain-containing protein [Firmicutes bacterium]|nr:DUF1385 domain-containing protein [Bacillota bacterium]